MSSRRKSRRSAPPHTRPSKQRQRLIDACISALHVYGPSRTTVAKVVAFAKMSPGIVRFYFDSKAAMLIASLQYLASEFEHEVLIPVATLKATPVAALQLMVDLFLDPDIASPRKVSAWYTFWGEASSRQEYYDICGQKDESFALLVRELVASLIVETRQPHLEPDGIALGLIGVLEILWQDIAFLTEGDIDRPSARRRCMGYLRSVFPGRFDSSPPLHGYRSAVPADANLFMRERERVFSGSWIAVGHESELLRAGGFLTADTGVERALVVRDAAGVLHALRNSCPVSPHVLCATRAGRFDGGIECAAHGLHFSLSGRQAGSAPHGDLQTLDLVAVQGLLFVRSRDSRQPAVMPDAWCEGDPPQGSVLLEAPRELAVAADWKTVIEHWLSDLPDVGDAVDHSWGAALYRRLTSGLARQPWRRQFVAPNQLIESRPDGFSVLQVLPVSAGRCRIRRLDFSALPPDDGARAVLYLAHRIGGYARRSTATLLESVQQGLTVFGYAASDEGPVSGSVSGFRDYLAACMHVAPCTKPPAAV